MQIENKAPETEEIVLTTKKWVTYISRGADGKVYVQVIDRKGGVEQRMVLGDPGYTLT
jgi:hypothetical protein